MHSTSEILKREPIYNLYILETHFLDPRLVQQNNKIGKKRKAQINPFRSSTPKAMNTLSAIL